jgi:hypothetical protein
MGAKECYINFPGGKYSKNPPEKHSELQKGPASQWGFNGASIPIPVGVRFLQRVIVPLCVARES